MKKSREAWFQRVSQKAMFSDARLSWKGPLPPAQQHSMPLTDSYKTLGDTSSYVTGTYFFL